MKPVFSNPLARLPAGAWLLLLVGLTFCRLYLTGDRDITALDSPHDEFWYVHRAFIGLWTGPYSQMSFMHPAVYVFWLQLLKIFGVPLRLGIDLAWVGSIWYLAISLVGFGASRLAALLAATFLLLQPYTIFIFDRPLAETLLVVAMTACIAAALQVWSWRNTAGGRRWLAVLAYSVTFAIAYHVRKEGVALLAPLLLLAGLSLFRRKLWWTQSSQSKPPVGVLLFICPLVATILLGLALSWINYVKWGTFARYDLSNPGYEKALIALSRINAGRTPLQVTVTRQMLEKAYVASPTMRELKPQMDGQIGKQWVDISSPFVTTKGEIGNGWFYWALRDAAAQAGWHSSAVHAERKYLAAANELHAAFSTGQLTRRTSVLPGLIDPDLGKWSPAVPESLWKVFRVSVFPRSSDIAPLPKDNATLAEFTEYSRVAGRRSLPPNINLSGWIVSPPGTMAGFAGSGGLPTWWALSESPRLDVPGAFSWQLTSEGIAVPDRIVFKAPDGRLGQVALSALQRGMTATTSGALTSTIGVDVLDTIPPARVADTKLVALASLADVFGIAFAFALTISVLSTVATRSIGPMTIAAGACLLFGAARLGMFAILDASSWNGAQARYMLPILPLFACAGALVISNLTRSLGSGALLRSRQQDGR